MQVNTKVHSTPCIYVIYKANDTVLYFGVILTEQ